MFWRLTFEEVCMLALKECVPRVTSVWNANRCIGWIWKGASNLYKGLKPSIKSPFASFVLRERKRREESGTNSRRFCFKVSIFCTPVFHFKSFFLPLFFLYQRDCYCFLGNSFLVQGACPLSSSLFFSLPLGHYHFGFQKPILPSSFLFYSKGFG